MSYVVVQSYWDRSGIIKIIGSFESENEAQRLSETMTKDNDVEGRTEVIPLTKPII